MPTRNSPPHFTTGIGVYTPWRKLDAHVQAALTAQAPKRAYEWKRGQWKDGKLVEGMPKQTDNRRVRVRGRKGWLKPKPMRDVYFGDKEGRWMMIPF